MVGLAVFHQRFLDAFFITALYKMILRKSITVADMDSVDDEMFRSLQWTLDNSIDGVLDLTFSTEADQFGELVTVDLKPGGRDIPVSDENKEEYVQLVSEWRIQTRVREQFTSFLTGFHELVPQDLVNVFDERELELLIGGIADFDLDDWRRNTEYRGYTEQDQVVQWFWKVFSHVVLVTLNSVSSLGMVRKRHVYSSLSLELRVSLSMGLKTCKAAMARESLRLRSLESPMLCQSRIPVSVSFLLFLINPTA